MEFDAYDQADFVPYEAHQAAARAMSGQHFRASEATDAEVRFIVSKCPCNFVQSFHEAWQTWMELHDGQLDYSKESFLSQHYFKQLSAAMDRFCSSRAWVKDEDGVIVID
jgi:hypothetical protein